MTTRDEFEFQHQNSLHTTSDDIEYHEGYPPSGDDWDYGYPDMHLGMKRSTVTGNLRSMVLDRNGLDPDAPHYVEILENHENGGYCGSCAFEYTVFQILIDGDEVFSVSYEDSPFAVFQEYLTEDTEDDDA